ncbi:DUF6498-containing protein [Salinarimonas ramus]|uniref:Uncharacterized protein n=1 Tax=Salinarimonas ramus TaxID=690164 RepID=A0A917QAE7_9HYPH|nr:DUF6498-containing protein [Salinarimonas ramus]GGK40189.1 hypothetical protein GCM10011322_29180 [Salinarimonas ramus]
MQPKTRPIVLSSVALVAANLVPLAGVLLGGWRVFDVLILFWAENVVIGVLNVARMVIVSLRGERGGLAMAGFFCLHYGIFTLVHGIFLVTLFGPSGADPFTGLVALATPALAWPLLALAASHGVSFIANFVVGGEMDRTDTGTLMAAPYGRVVVLHVAIIFGGFAVTASGAPILALALLVGLKILVDLGAHVREHKHLAEGPARVRATKHS